MAEIIIAKHRNGAVGDVLMRFKSKFARFENRTDKTDVPIPGVEDSGIIASKMNTQDTPPPSDLSISPDGDSFNISPEDLPF